MLTGGLPGCLREAVRPDGGSGTRRRSGCRAGGSDRRP
ncbi:protein of unassigned function [Methylobacterium oryzae CBMB20]|uniref:Protein of unassigned function n=1 Tax=Methylobacterium oryzae CBMB20 TaxID=693986 RepID=A0A089P1G4_9HYPH|nr:protein of unassigned function [Methylobacterium oryzae CBMB20]